MAHLFRAFRLIAGTVLLPLGCVAPPPLPANSPGAAAGTGTTPPPADGVIWDGEGAGESAKGWSDCDKKPNCKSTLAATPGVGKDGTAGLKWHGEGDGWIGMGWNWVGWYPENGGTDISGFKAFTFWVRIEAKNKEQVPDLSAITASIGCSKGGKTSASSAFSKYAKNSLDGQWHKVTIPVSMLSKGEGKDFDPKTAWEFRLSHWSGTPRSFDVYVDQIAFEK
jgi:hypothetical protein